VIRLSIPMNLLRGVMLTISVTGVVLGSLFFGKLFSLVALSVEGIIVFAVFSLVTIIIFNLLYNISHRYVNKYKN
jgi:hypothetical protein